MKIVNIPLERETLTGTFCNTDKPVARVESGDIIVCASLDGDWHLEKPETPRAIMEFKTIDLAYGLFTGTASTMAELCAGNIYMAGMISMVDNINRILDRVAVYLG